MNKGEKAFIYCLAVLIGLMVALLLLAVSNYGSAVAEAIPSPTATDMLRIGGDMRKSGAPMDLDILDWARVDVDTRGDKDTLWAEIALSVHPPGALHVLLYDGYHIARAEIERTGEYSIRAGFAREELLRMDSTVGLYLVIMCERGETQ